MQMHPSLSTPALGTQQYSTGTQQYSSGAERKHNIVPVRALLPKGVQHRGTPVACHFGLSWPTVMDYSTSQDAPMNRRGSSAVVPEWCVTPAGIVVAKDLIKAHNLFYDKHPKRCEIVISVSQASVPYSRPHCAVDLRRVWRNGVMSDGGVGGLSKKGKRWHTHQEHASELKLLLGQMTKWDKRSERKQQRGLAARNV